MLKTREENRVFMLTMNKPPLNTLDQPFMRELIACFTELTERPPEGKPRVVVLGSALPKVFSHGIDPQAFVKEDLDGRKNLFLQLFQLFTTMLNCGIPLVVDVNGGAFAGGAVLAVLGDFSVIDKEHGKISFSEVKVGIPIPKPIHELCLRKIFPGVVADALLLGRNFGADEAVQYGFCQRTYTHAAERDEALMDYCGKIGRLSPPVVTQTVMALREESLASFRSFRDRFDSEMTKFFGDEFLGKGLKAVLKGEKPVF